MQEEAGGVVDKDYHHDVEEQKAYGEEEPNVDHLNGGGVGDGAQQIGKESIQHQEVRERQIRTHVQILEEERSPAHQQEQHRRYEGREQDHSLPAMEFEAKTKFTSRVVHDSKRHALDRVESEFFWPGVGPSPALAREADSVLVGAGKPEVDAALLLVEGVDVEIEQTGELRAELASHCEVVFCPGVSQICKENVLINESSYCKYNNQNL